MDLGQGVFIIRVNFATRMKGLEKLGAKICKHASPPAAMQCSHVEGGCVLGAYFGMSHANVEHVTSKNTYTRNLRTDSSFLATHAREMPSASTTAALSTLVTLKHLPGKPGAYNYGLLSVNSGLLWGIVACYFGLLGFPGFFGFFGLQQSRVLCFWLRGKGSGLLLEGSFSLPQGACLTGIAFYIFGARKGRPDESPLREFAKLPDRVP